MREIIRNAITSSLQPLERYLYSKNHLGATPPPCFIIGAPRSGTTLVYEALTIRYGFAYFSNLAERFYNTPAAATYLGSNLLVKRKSSSFINSYGQVNGWCAPSEGGRIWNRWIPQPYYLPGDHVASLPVEEMRRIVASISNSFNAPFLNKNVMHSVHIDLLDKIFPGCVFIEVRREPVANIRSIIRARNKNGGPKVDSNWWSVKPRIWQQYKNSSTEEQACVQVCSLREDIANQINNISQKRLMIVHYEEFCKNPAVVMNNIHAFIKKQLKCEVKNKTEIQQKFSTAISTSLSAQSEEYISHWVSTYFSRE